MKLALTALVTAVVVLALLWLTLVVVARSGSIDVAATADFLPGAEWFFSTLKRNSVEARARQAVASGEIRPPAEPDADMLAHGAVHYREMCVVCHGAPGVPRGEFGQGLTPRPPDLAEVAREWSPEEIYWVLDHGIRHTGMPAFGVTHSEDELWGIVAFIEALGGMSPEDYRRHAGDGAGDGAGSGAGHGHGGDDHHPGDDHHGEAAAAASPETAEPAGEQPPGGGHAHDDGHDHPGHEH